MAKKITIAAAAALITLAAAACLGSSSVHLRDTVSIIAHKLFSSPLPETIGSHTVAIIWSIRIPRVLMAFLVGGALSVSGAVVQSVLRNPLASPYTLGVSSGAALGAGIIIITGLTVPFLGMYLLPFTGLIFGIVTVVAAIAFASRVDRTLSTNTIILSGLVFSLFVGAMLTLLARLNRESIERIALWHLGTFASRGFSHIGGILPFLVVGFIVPALSTRELDVLTFGEEQAKSMGVETEKVKWLLLCSASLLAGSSVAFTGIIGFVDLIVPHIVRRIFGSAHKYVIPMCMVCGGIFTVIADLIARTLVAPSELPVGVISALCGAPFFMYVYFRKRK